MTHHSRVALRERSTRPSWCLRRSLPVAVLAVGALLTAGCVSSNGSGGLNDGGVRISTSSAATASTAPTAAGSVAVVVGDSKGLNGPMTLVAAVPSAPAGDVTFVVKNTGTVEHEMLVLKTDVAFDKIPIADSGDPPVPVSTGADKIDEADNVAETGDPNLQPGDVRTFTATGLTPGKYVLVCNIAKHYGLGMRAAFTVT